MATYNPEHPDADWSGYVKGGGRAATADRRGGSDMAALFGAPPPATAKTTTYVKPPSDNFIGGPSYPDLKQTQYRSTAQAAAEGDPTDKGNTGKKKITNKGPTVTISPVTGLPLCDYGNWAQQYEEDSSPTAKPKPIVRPKPPANPTVENLKSQLKARGASGISGMQRKFKIMDDDGSGHLNKEEFKKGMRECSLELTDSEMDKLFAMFDKDRSGTITFDEFLTVVRGEMNDARREIVHQAFDILDSDGSGVVDGDEIAAKYDASKHPDVISGKRTPKMVMLEFLQTFDVGGEVDGKVTRQEFENYYSNISASIDSDVYFELMMRNAWHISGGEGQAASSANLRVLVTMADGSQKVVEVKNDLGIKNKNDPGYQADLERRLRAQGLKDFEVAKGDTGKAGKGRSSSGPPVGSAEQKANAAQALEKLRGLLAARGGTGIVGLQRRFKIMNDDGTGQLSCEEFKKGMKECTLQLTDREMHDVFLLFDRDKSGTISFDELLGTIKGVMNEGRKELVHLAFNILDTDGSGVIDGDEIAAKYDASKHPDVISGKRTPKMVLLEFLQTFDVGGEDDGKVTRQEFENYYSNISASIDSDVYFELMMRNAWHISGDKGQAANSSKSR